ncbi:MAG: hypothetical protein HYX75_09895 [Acidobacteria bacterium]|nr:hypothetical protein [Acidobacteriota bacterium]
MRYFPCVALALLVMTGMAAAEDADQDRIKQLETRIEELERRLTAASPQGSAPEIEELRRQLTILAEEIEKLRSEGEKVEEMTEAQRRSLGLGPAAASVYSRKHGVSLAGYGEMLYENFDEATDAGASSGKVDQLDFVRAIVYFGHRFNDRVLFNSELEFEHASTGSGGEVSVEFAYLDYRLRDSASLRGGMLLIPMGLVNEFHEPTVYLGTRRPVTESLILPSTWRENGFGVVGRAGMFDYRAYVVNGLNAGGFSSSGLRGGRQKGAAAKLRSPSFVGRADITPTAGLLVGGSLYAGNSGLFSPTSNPSLEVKTLIGELHGEYRAHGLELRALYARASLDNVAALNRALNLTGSASVGETLSGGYVQAGYDLLAGRGKSGWSVTPYFRYEQVNTQSEVPEGFTINPAREQSVRTVGVEVRPIFQVVVKADYQMNDTEAGTGVDQWNISLGYSF